MPMISIESVKKAEVLIQERGRIRAATWDHVTEKGLFGHQTPADEELQQAIEEFRKRKLDGIAARLREVGVDPSEPDSSA